MPSAYAREVLPPTATLESKSTCSGAQGGKLRGDLPVAKDRAQETFLGAEHGRGRRLQVMRENEGGVAIVAR